jgi:uncharacterized protein (DUF1778 family)
MKIGRPKLSSSQKKAEIAGVRLKPDERSLMEEAASQQNERLSEWMRKNLLSAAKRQLRRFDPA